MIGKWVRNLLGLVLLAMVLLNVVNAAGRYLFGLAVHGSDEILVFAMVWLVFLGAALVSLEGRHLGFDLLHRYLPPGGQRALHVIICLGTALLTGYAAWQSWQVVAKLARIGKQSMATEIPMALPHVAVPLSLGLICLISLVRATRTPDWLPRDKGSRSASKAGSDRP